MSLYDLFTKINSGVYLPLSASRYSSELRYLIDSMLRVDANARVDINDVVTYCEKHIAQMMQQTQNGSNSDPLMKRITRMDPVLIMDDIIEKLHLLDYIKKFCPKYNRKPISRTYFALHSPFENPEEKVRYFVELSYWLMSLGFS
jgi:Intra-flagellar transport protein 57